MPKQQTRNRQTRQRQTRQRHGKPSRRQREPSSKPAHMPPLDMGSIRRLFDETSAESSRHRGEVGRLAHHVLKTAAVGSAAEPTLSTNAMGEKLEDPWKFSDTLDVDVSATNQFKSRRCWIFSFANMVRMHVIARFGLSSAFNISHTYLFFYDLMEKSHYFLRSIWESRDKGIMERIVQHMLDKPVSDGGHWNMIQNLVRKYGVVPAGDMPDTCLLYTSPSPRDGLLSRMPSSA